MKVLENILIAIFKVQSAMICLAYHMNISAFSSVLASGLLDLQINLSRHSVLTYNRIKCTSSPKGTLCSGSCHWNCLWP